MKLSQNVKFMSGARCTCFCLLLFVLVLHAASVSARTLGMVADEQTNSVTVFDADTDTVLGTVLLPNPLRTLADVLITPDQTRGFAINFTGNVFVIDLTTSPPRLAGGTNPIPISNPGEDLAISPDGKYLLVVDGGEDIHPISVIDIARQAEISTFNVSGVNHNSVDVCIDGSVLVTSVDTGNIYRLTIDGAGNLTDTHEVLFSGGAGAIDGPNNVYCAPDGKSGFIVRRTPHDIRSFKIPLATLEDTRLLTGTTNGISGLFSMTGDRAFARSNGSGAVDVFDYDSKTAVLGAMPLFSISIADTILYLGMDQMALHPNNAKLYVSQPNALNIYDASSGALLNTITNSNIVQPTGVAIAPDRCLLPPPAGAIVGTSGNDTLVGTAGDDVIFGLEGDDIINGGGGNDLICGGPGKDILNGGDGDDTISGGDGDDNINGDSGNDTLRGSLGNDAINGGSGNDAINGGTGHDSINANGGDDAINAGDGNDILNGGAGNDTIYAGAGNDRVNGGPGEDKVFDEAGDDILNVADGVSGNDRVDGGTGNDTCNADQSDTVTNCNP